MSLEDIFNAVLNYQQDQIQQQVQKELDRDANVTDILNKGLIAAMDEVGKRFSENKLFIPEMLMAAKTMKSGMEVLRPLLSDSNVRTRGTVVLGAVKGDLHDIGKNLVAMLLEGAGFNVVDLGVDVDTEQFLSAAAENQAEIIGMSALLTTTMPTMRITVSAIKEKGANVKTMVGGAPVTQEFADQIGADGYSIDAVKAVQKAKELLAR
ncbi:MAG: corrinoid protein [Deltaproteobacteria bacterium]|nr:corrinoid protein [Deltaproteobacteria bacterium]